MTRQREEFIVAIAIAVIVIIFATWLADAKFHRPYKPGDMDSIYEDQ